MLDIVLGLGCIFLAAHVLNRYSPNQKDQAAGFQKLLGGSLATIEMLNKTIEIQSRCLNATVEEIASLQQRIANFEEIWGGDDEEEDEEEEKPRQPSEAAIVMYRKMEEAIDIAEKELGPNASTTVKIKKLLKET